MPSHKYQVGCIVRVSGSKSLGALQGRFEIVRLMPPAADYQNQYRVRSTESGHERMVKEHDISRV